MGNLNSIKEIKIELRKLYKNYRLNLSKSVKNDYDLKIFNKLISLWVFKENDIILPYASTEIEVDTFRLIEYSLSIGKKVALPYCIDNSCEMDFYFIKSLDDLKVRSFNVYEPIAEKCEKLIDLTQGLCIVPALAYDKNGYRLGYGKGYYDRFLSKFSGQTVGICYNDCVTNSLPHGKYDKNVDLLVTQKFVKPTSNI